MPQVLEDCFRLLLQKAANIPDPFEHAFFVMVQVPYLQPFEDVNKPVSRLGANISLIRSNLSPLSFVDVPEQAYADGTMGVYEFNQVDLLEQCRANGKAKRHALFTDPGFYPGHTRPAT
jgi:Fic family protein